jgi:hypothetical protein
MTPQNAYLQGLTDAENNIKRRVEQFLNQEDVQALVNPEMEELMIKILTQPQSTNEVTHTTIDNKFISKLESSIKYEPDRRNWTNTEFQDERLNNLFKALTNTIDYCWNLSKHRHAAAKAMKRILKESEEMIATNVDISETEIKS